MGHWIKTLLPPLNKQIAEWARKGAALGDCGKMCSCCAFKLNTVPNKDADNVDIAAQCVVFEGTFCCHMAGDNQPAPPCAGFLYAKQYINSIDG